MLQTHYREFLTRIMPELAERPIFRNTTVKKRAQAGHTFSPIFYENALYAHCRPQHWCQLSWT